MLMCLKIFDFLSGSGITVLKNLFGGLPCPLNPRLLFRIDIEWYPFLFDDCAREHVESGVCTNAEVLA